MGEVIHVPRCPCEMARWTGVRYVCLVPKCIKGVKPVRSYKIDGKLHVYVDSKPIDIPNCKCGSVANGWVRLDTLLVRPYCFDCHRRDYPDGEIV